MFRSQTPNDFKISKSSGYIIYSDLRTRIEAATLQAVIQPKTIPSRYELMTLQREKSELTEQSLVAHNYILQVWDMGFRVQDLGLESQGA